MEKHLTKKDIADILEQIGMLLELKGENPFKSRAYINASRIILNLEEDLDSLVATGALSSIRGIGEALSKKISTLVLTGHLDYLDSLQASVPPEHLTMLRIRGLGPKKIVQLHQLLDIKTIQQLEAACRENRLLTVRGFGQKIQENILKGIEQLRTHSGLHLYPTAAAEMDTLLSYLHSGQSLVKALSPAGSLRRKCALVRDIDLVASSDQPAHLSDFYASYPPAESVLEKGDTKVSLLLESGLQADLRIVRQDEFPFALHHFTGSKEHNIALRGRALRADMTINEYGIATPRGAVSCKSEEDFFAALGLSYIPPELRENTGEIEAAELGHLPRLIDLSDIRGVFHIHTAYSDGTDSIKSLAAAAQQMGFEYIGIADHSRSAYYARGLSIENVRKQCKEIDAFNAGETGIHVFKGIEIEILPNGSLDYDEEVLDLFDFVIAAVHSHFSMPESEMTERVLCALDHPHVTMLAHPTGRLLLSREPYAIDLAKIIDRAASSGKIIELNAHPDRLDLDWRWCKIAKKKGVMLSINPDAHHAAGLADLQYGIDHARKGWLEPADCLNSLPLKAVKRLFKQKRGPV